MIRSRTSKGLGQHTATIIHHASVVFATRLLPAAHNFQNFVRLACRQRTVAVALCAASISGLATFAAVVTTVQHLHAAQVQPLAPAPSPMNAVAATAAVRPRQKHHLLSSFVANPLHGLAVNALHGFAANSVRGIAAHSMQGLASWYGSVLHGHKTASGETFDEGELTACHRTLPFGTLVRVTDTASQRSVIVRINDRGVLNPDRVIDLSAAAADQLGMLRSGLAKVQLEILPQRRPTPPREATDTD